MNSHKISYCNSSGFLLKNNRSKFDIIDNIKNRLGYDFINPIYKSYSDRLLPIIKKNNLICTYITSGKSVYMYLTKIYNENICLVIELEKNKQNKYPKIISIPCNFSDTLFNNTLFFGEVYRDHKKKWFFIIEDILLLNGNNPGNTTIKKIKTINNIIGKQYKYLPLSPFIVKIKKYFTLDKITENINKLDIRLKGIKFLGLKNPICFYFLTNYYNKEKNIFLKLPGVNNDLTKDKDIIKNDYLEEQNIDLDIIDNLLFYKEKEYYLELRKSDCYGIYNLFANYNKNLLKIGIARTDSIEISLRLLKILKSLDAIIVKVILDKDFKKFTVKEILPDSNIISNYSDIIKELDIVNKFPKPNYIKN